VIEARYRTFWRRFWAGVVDWVVVASSFFVLRQLMAISRIVIPEPAHGLWQVVGSLCSSAYSIILHGKYGQTVGKMILRVKVLDLSEQKLRMFQAFRRDFVPLVLNITYISMVLSRIDPTDVDKVLYSPAARILGYTNLGWFIAELVTMLASKKRRAVHDFIAGSVVVRCPRQPAQADAADTANAGG